MKEGMRYWSEKEIEHFLKRCRKDKRLWCYPVFRLIIWNGLRPAEIVALTLNDLRGEVLDVPVVAETTGRRLVGVDEETKRSLEEWGQNNTLLREIFPELSVTRISRTFEEIRQDVGLPPIELEDFRPMLRINLRKQGISEIAIDDKLGG